MNVIEKLSNAMKNREITVYALAKLTGIKYELLRRTFVRKRKLTANELVLILQRTKIPFDEII